MKFCFLLFITFQSLICQNSHESGYVIYQVLITEAYVYSDQYKNLDLENYNRAIKRDSLMNNIELGVVFSKERSKSFRLKEYQNNSMEYDAVYKANGIADYSFDTKANTSIVSMNYWFQDILISISLENKWDIDYKKTKIIDGKKCYYAKYKGKGLWWELNPEKPTFAWFAPSIPLPFGPLHYNGLPGLILELNVENVRYAATKIGFDNTYLSKMTPIDLSKHEGLSEAEFIEKRAEIRRNAKRIITGG